MTLDDIFENTFLTKKVVWQKRGSSLEKKEIDLNSIYEFKSPWKNNNDKDV